MPYGNNAVIGIAFQNSFTQAAAVGSLFHLPLLNEDLGLNQEELISQNLNGRFDEGDAYSGRRDYGGRVECEAQPKAFGALITSVVNDPVSVTSASLRTYTWSPRTGDFAQQIPNRPVTYYKYLVDGGSAQLFYDLCGARLEFSQSEGGFLLARANYVGGKTSAVASTALTQDSTPRWPWNNSSASLGGAAVTDFSDITVTHDEGINPRWLLDGQLVANRIKRQARRTIRVSGSLVFETQDELDNFRDETAQRLVLTWQRLGTEIQSGYFNTFEIVIPSFKWLSYKPSIRGAGEIEVQFTGKGDYHPGSGTSVRYTLINTWAAGYTA